ncbi:type VI secretion system baseplate subunit TssF [Aestuariibius sp. 2305UL40-4]|uniref:type VI secretion system baseplate subunit TssF n=1 Tax=Aestuariibius violaceus TaxID=3234132 RepID=UPI00345E085D
MKKAFRDAYERELALLYERSAEFAAEYPGLADRLGGLMKENLDPAIAGLLEGTAFLAARVQLKMDEEFRTFTREYLDQIFPDAIDPTPSAALVRGNPPLDDKDIVHGKSFPAGSYIDARFVDADQRVSCRFQTCAPLTLWPLAIPEAAYHDALGRFTALGLDPAQGTKAGLQIDLARAEGTGALAEVEADEITLHFLNEFSEAIALYEQIHCGLTRATLRWLDKNGDPVFQRLDPKAIEQINFDPRHRVFPRRSGHFHGFALLREAFVFPRAFLGMKLTGLSKILPRIDRTECQLLLEFDSANPALAARLEAKDLSLHTVPAVNLFEEHSASVRIDDKRHEYVVTPDSSPVTHYEFHRILDVWAHYPGVKSKVRVHRLYDLPEGDLNPRQALYYTDRKKQRRLTEQERRFGQRHRYRGTETFISIYEPPGTPEEERAQRLQVRGLASNRHLPDHLPLAGSDTDFYMTDDVAITLACVAGPTKPRESMTEIEKSGPHRATQGDNYWRLISYLSLSEYGLDHRGDRLGASALREMLSLFTDLSDAVTEAQLVGIRAVETRPIVRSIKRGTGYHPARGLEIRITFDETAFEGSGIMLLGAVLDRFMAEHAAINSFTQTVIASEQRGDIHTFPPRTGTGPLI